MKKKLSPNDFNTLAFLKKTFLLLPLLLLQWNVSYAQIQLVPIPKSSSESVTQEETSSGRTEASLNLPFFDDFSTATTASPDLKYWMPGSGVYVNNTLTTNHPSINVATFDGVNANGTPYNFINPLFQNFTDTLISQPINLAGKASKDSIYLSFYWQGKGLGEFPDSSDYIMLEFLGVDKEWTTIWTQNGYNIDTTFRQQFIAIKDARFFHANFQFRFRGFGRNSGPYDTWHLDYIYLNEKRSARDRFIRDITVRKPLSSFFKNYRAMPLRQYKVNPTAATAASVSTDIINLNNRENVNSFTFTVRDRVTGKRYMVSGDSSVYIGPYTGSGPFKNQERIIKLNPLNIDASARSVSLQYKLEVLTTDDQNPDVAINLKRNDTISSYTDLSDYYAFDDGSAEYGVQVNQKLGRVAVRYILSKPDTIAGIRMSLIPFNKDISSQSFTIQLYSNKGGKPDQIIAQRAIAAKYPEKRNDFLEYAFANPVAVADTFYVGWLQINEQPVTFGFDRNSLLGSQKIFYNLGNSWAAETKLPGSIMIRPYVGNTGQEVITGTEPISDRDSYFFPNPNKGTINWKSSLLKRIEVYSVSGTLLQTIFPQKGSQSAVLNIVNTGIYLIKGFDGKQFFVQKVLIEK